jgi:DNA-binding CsgD family transcriptional regulator
MKRKYSPKIKQHKYILLMIFSIVFSCSYANELDSLLKVLDHTIANREVYHKKKMEEIDVYRQAMYVAPTLQQQFNYCGRLYTAFLAVNADSALYYAKKKQQLSAQIPNHLCRIEARMNMAEMMMRSAMYKEATEIMSDIESKHLSHALKGYYFHIYRTLYGLLSDNSFTIEQRSYYNQFADHYRDSILLVNDKSSSTYIVVEADKNNVHGNAWTSIKSLKDFIEKHKDNNHIEAMMAYTLSEAYRMVGDEENQIRCLAISSIADISAGIKEYKSLKDLALLLYKRGEIDRAYNYLQLSINDAIASNARQRMIEILEVFPDINRVYQKKKKEQQDTLETALLIISGLLALLLIGVIVVTLQKRKVTLAKTLLKKANEQMQQLNAALSDANNMKENYISQYMGQCMLYLKKQEKYRSHLFKLLQAKEYKTLYNELKSDKLMNEELKIFYREFDETFLKLYPTFIEQFNALLISEENVLPKKGELLSTELRIYALIRLGISDSNRIAEFLHYSTTTIYNYRTKVRNKAAVDRTLFEEEVMKISSKIVE